MTLKELKEKDIFGYVLEKYLKESTSLKYYIRRDDEMLSLFEDVSMYFSEFEEWTEEEKEAMKYVRGTFLDAGAGAGRVSLYLQEQGLKGIALDISVKALEVCKERGVKKTLKESICSITKEKINQEIGTVILFGNNFGVCGGYEPTIRMLKKLHELTSDEGRIIASSRNATATDDPEHLAYHQMNREKGRPAGLVRIRLEYEEVKGDWWELLMVSEKVMKELAEKAGWEVKEIIGEPKNYIAILDKKQKN